MIVDVDIVDLLAETTKRNRKPLSSTDTNDGAVSVIARFDSTHFERPVVYSIALRAPLDPRKACSPW